VKYSCDKTLELILFLYLLDRKAQNQLQGLNLDFSMCLPDVCSASDVTVIATVVGGMLGLEPTEDSNQNQQNQCHTDESESLTGLDIFAM
jgi:hypothetical protein